MGKCGRDSLTRRLGTVATCFLLSAAFMFLRISEAHADSQNNSKDTIVFTNGDRLSGKLIQATHDAVTFLGDVTKLISLQWNNIQEIDLSAHALCVIGKTIAANGASNNFELDQAKIKVEGTDLIFSSTAADIQRMPIDQLLFAAPKASEGNQTRPQPRSLLQGWGGPFQSQDSLTSSTQHQYQVGASFYPARATQSNEAFAYQITSINLDANYGESKKPGASPVITQVYEGSLQQDIYITDNYDECDKRRWGGARVFAQTDFYHNLSLGMNLEQVYAAGLAWDRQSGRERLGAQKYGFSAGLGYIGEDLYSPGQAQKLIAAKLGQNYQIKLVLVKGKPILLSESGSVIPAFNNSHTLQARGIAKLTVPLTPKFSVGVQETDDYLRNAPPKSKQNYSSLQVTFAYALGAAPK